MFQDCSRSLQTPHDIWITIQSFPEYFKIIPGLFQIVPNSCISGRIPPWPWRFNQKWLNRDSSIFCDWFCFEVELFHLLCIIYGPFWGGGEEGIEDRIDVELRREGEEGGDPGFDPASFLTHGSWRIPPGLALILQTAPFEMVQES